LSITVAAEAASPSLELPLSFSRIGHPEKAAFQLESRQEDKLVRKLVVTPDHRELRRASTRSPMRRRTKRRECETAVQMVVDCKFVLG
jgi:hypothetical protein